ncbi:MAG: hypothetical protein B6D53_04830 [Candidatus Omnitrophica bacterium 4484_49]|nr:MAG: hypothetical protein B6D53_04830 [Candidatus Omnitrophica bacterium 4484_49]
MRDFYLYFKLYPRLLNTSVIKNGLSYIWARKTTFPLTINFLITSKCNFKCKMCSFYGSGQPETPDLSTPEIIKFIKTISSYKPIIHIGGGEPFMRKDIYQIITEIKKLGMPLLITTNGYLLDTAKIKKLDVDYIIFSLYGPPQVHNEITGITDAYEIALKKIKALPKERVIVSTTVMLENVDYLEEFIKTILEHGIRKIKVENLNYITPQEYENHPSEINGYILKPTTLITPSFSHSQVQKLWKRIGKLKTRYRGKFFLKPDLDKKGFFNWYLGRETNISCNFIRHSIFIDSDGAIIPCQFLKDCKLGNITRDDVKYVWRSQNFEKFRELIDRLNLPVCRRCCKS